MIGSGCNSCLAKDECRAQMYRGTACKDNRAKHGLGDPFTKADKIRSMTDDELAAVVMVIGSVEDKIHFCQNLQECDELLETMDGVPEEKCIGCILQWLQQPAGEQP